MPDFDIGKLIGYVELDDSGVAEGAKSAETRIEGLGKSGSTLAKAAGVGMGLALAAGLASAVSIDAGQAKLTAQLDLSAAESQRYGGIAGKLYSGAFGENMDEVNEGIRQVVLNIGGMADASDADLERVSGKVLNLSQVFDQDLGQTTRAVGTLLRNGLAKDADEALDLLTRGFQNGTNVADDLLDTVSEYSVQFRKLGLDGEASLGLLHQGLEGGARDADTVADALKELSIRAIDGSEATGTAYEQLGLDGEEMARKFAAGGETARGALDTVLESIRATKDPTERSAAAVGLFGTKAEDLGAALYDLDLDTAADSMGNVEGAAKRVGDALGGSAAAQFTTLTRSGELFVTSVGQAVLPLLSSVGGTLLDVVTPALSAAGSAVGAVADGFEALPGPVQTTVITLAALVAMRDPLSGLWGSVKTAGADALESIQLRAMYARDAMAAEGVGLAGGIRAAATAGEGAAKGGLALMSGALGGPLGIAIAGATIALPLLSSLIGKNSDTTDDAAKSTGGFAEALQASKGAIDANVRAAAGKEAQDRGLLDVAEAAGVSLNRVTEAILEGGSAYDEVAAALELYSNQQLIASGYEDDAAGTHHKAADAAGTAKDTLADLAHQLPENVTQAQQLAAATDGATDATDGQTDAAKAAEDAAKAQADAVDALKDAIDRYTGGAIGAAQAQINVSDGLASLSDLTAENTATLDQQTQAGRDAKGAFLDQITAIQDLATATYRQTGSTDDAKDAYYREIDALRARLTELGYNQDEVDQLIQQYGAIPESVFTNVSTNAGGVESVIDRIGTKLATLHNTRYTVDVYETVHSDGTVSRKTGVGYNLATGGVLEFYADGGHRPLSPMAAGKAARVPANTWRVIGDRPVGDEFYLPDDDAPATLSYGAEWARRRGLGLVPVAAYADGGTYPAAPATLTATAAGSYADAATSVLFTGPVSLRDERDAQQLAEDLDWRRRTRGGRR